MHVGLAAKESVCYGCCGLSALFNCLGAFQCELQVFLDSRAVAGNIGECLREGEAIGHQNVNAESALQYARQGHPETF